MSADCKSVGNLTWSIKVAGSREQEQGKLVGPSRVTSRSGDTS